MDRNHEAIAKLQSLIKGTRIAMLTTQATDGTLHSRPMAVQQTDFDGDLWFFTGAGSGKIGEVHDNANVNVSIADTDHQHYVSISGPASIVRDRAKAEELWNPIFKAWFPKGLDDPDLALLRVKVQQAEYWDAPSSTMVHVVGFVKAILTGKRYEPGEHEKVDLQRGA